MQLRYLRRAGVALATAVALVATGTAVHAKSKYGEKLVYAYAGGIWNAKFGRSPLVVKTFLADMVKKHNLDFVALQEFRDYVPYLEKNPIAGYELAGYTPEGQVRGGTQNPILVRKSIAHTPGYSADFGGDGWTTVDGAHHVAVRPGFTVLEGALRVYSVHAPVSVNWRKGKIYGPAERVDDYIAHSAAVVRNAQEASAAAEVTQANKTDTGGSDHAFITFKVTVPGGQGRQASLFAGDWNARRTDTGGSSPTWMIKNANLGYTSPALTGPGHVGIDYLLHTKGKTG